MRVRQNNTFNMNEDRVVEEGTGSSQRAENINKQLAYERWRGAMGEFLSKVCSTIGRRPVPVEWASQFSGASGDAIAYTDGETIFLNGNYFRDALGGPITSRNMASAIGPIATIKGASYHELAHVIYTPRRNHRPTKDIIDLEQSFPGIFMMYNILEDQRIEMLFAAKYRPVIPYFTQMIAQFILSADPLRGAAVVGDGSESMRDGLSFMLLYGRRYLPADVIKQSYVAHVEFLNTHKINVDVNELKRIINAYRTLRFPRDASQAVTLVQDFWTYWNEINKAAMPPGFQPPLGIPGNCSPTGNHTTHTNGSHDRENIDVDIQVVEEFAEDNDPGCDGDDADSEEADGNSTGTAEAGVAASNSSDGDSAPSNNDGDNAGKDDSASPNDGGSAGSGVSNAPTQSTGLGDVLREVIKQAQDGWADDAQASLKAIRSNIHKSYRTAKPDLGGSHFSQVKPVMKVSSRKIKDTILTIRAEGEEMWDRGQSIGKLNAGLAMGARGTHFDVFDQWIDAGDDATSFEVVMLIDQSSSMSGFSQNAVSEGLWVIRSAFQDLDIPVTVIGYDSTARLLFRPFDKVPPQTTVINAWGNTNPDPALEWALSIFQASSAAHKLLFSLTDGQWMNSTNLFPLMSEMKSLGVKTCLFQQGVPDYRIAGKFIYDRIPKHKYWHDYAVEIGDSTKELPNAVSKAVANLSREATRR